MGFNVKRMARNVKRTVEGLAGDVFGENKMYDTLNDYQKGVMNQLGQAYSAEVAAGVNPDYSISQNYFKDGIQKQALKGFDTGMQKDIDAGFANSMSGTGNIMASARGLGGLQNELQAKRVGLDYQELLGARERLNAARQGLAGLSNVTTRAQVNKPGLLSGAAQGIGLAASAQSMFGK